MLYAQAVVRLRRPDVRDPYSEDVRPGEWRDATERRVPGAIIAPSQSVAVQDAIRTQTVTTLSVFCPPGVDIAPGDRVRDAVGIWEVESVGVEWVNPYTGSRRGIEYRLTKVVG
jgi:hypothetical protein